MSTASDIFNTIAGSQEQARFKAQNWTGTFEEYLEVVEAKPLVAQATLQGGLVYVFVSDMSQSSLDELRKSLLTTSSSLAPAA